MPSFLSKVKLNLSMNIILADSFRSSIAIDSVRRPDSIDENAISVDEAGVEVSDGVATTTNANRVQHARIAQLAHNQFGVDHLKERECIIHEQKNENSLIINCIFDKKQTGKKNVFEKLARILSRVF